MDDLVWIKTVNGDFAVGSLVDPLQPGDRAKWVGSHRYHPGTVFSVFFEDRPGWVPGVYVEFIHDADPRYVNSEPSRGTIPISEIRRIEEEV